MQASARILVKESNRILSKYRVSDGTTSSAVFNFLEALNSPRALTVWLLYSSNEHQQLVDLDIDPNQYRTADEFRSAYAATMLLSKSDFLKLDVDRKQKAFEKFDQFELLCKQTNRRFSHGVFDPLYKGPNVWLLNATKRKIHSILGAFNPLEVIDLANWGPGVTNSIKGERATNVNKFQYETGITRDLYSLWFDQNLCSDFGAPYLLWQEDLSLRKGFPTFEVGNVTVTVPKTAKIDRVISIEPGLNLWYQKGLGQAIRRRLRSKGVDLNDQTVNQKLAKSAVKSGLATVDFSSASDSISYQVVRELIPPEWFEKLDAARSHFGIRDGKPRKWEKFSSMGNGFTFELESLIFFAAACAVAEFVGISNPTISVYGDDVIIPNSIFDLFSSFSEYLGFVVNKGKSFFSGVFRESCGSHYFDGVDVKPIFLKKKLATPSSVYKLANAIRWFSHYSYNYMGCDKNFRFAFYSLVKLLPKSVRFRIPVGYGEGGFISNFDEAAPSHAKYGIEGYYTSHMTFVAVRRQSEGVGLLLTRLRSSSTREEGNFFPLRGRTTISVKRLFVPRWYDLGPWF